MEAGADAKERARARAKRVAEESRLKETQAVDNGSIE